MTTHDNSALPPAHPQPIRNDNLLISFTTEFLRIWDTSGSRATPAAFWRPVPAADVLPGYFPLGDVVIDGNQNITGKHVVAVVREAETASIDPAKGTALRRPDDYELVWRDSGSRSKKDGAIWKPVPPQGYVALGWVCSDGHEKPSFNAVRCVRADLLTASGLSEAAWSDRGSGARQSISLWSAITPAARPDEIHLAPGTFIGVNSYTRPASFVVHALRIPVLMESNPRPAVPVLENGAAPVMPLPGQPTFTARLPWFTIKDSQLTPPQQFRQSPEYLLQRTDHHQLVGHCQNMENTSKTMRWTASRLQKNESLRAFANATSIEFGSQWQSNLPRPFVFSARLNNDFAQCESHSNEWLNPAPIEVAAIVPRKSSMAVYLTQSDYTLLRTDGTQVGSKISYTDGKNLHLSQYSTPPLIETALPTEASPAHGVNNESTGVPTVAE